MASHTDVGGCIKGQECILLPTVPSAVDFWGDILIVIALKKCFLCVRGQKIIKLKIYVFKSMP